MLGALVAQDLLVFYLFWEAMLLPMYFLIGVWGGDERKYAATKFVLFTLSGSLLWLVALLFLAGKAGSFAPGVMAQAVAGAADRHPEPPVPGLRPGLRHQGAPVPPAHLAAGRPHPGAHRRLGDPGRRAAEAGLVRLPALRPAHVPGRRGRTSRSSWPCCRWSAIVYGALVAMVQTDIKKLVAYSSVSHMGFIMLGIASMTVLGTQGAMLQMLNHGISTGALFLLVGMLYDRAHTRRIADFGGVALKMPVFTTFFLIVTLSSIGLPLTNGFAGEFLILNGTYISGFAWGRALACVATLGVLLSAVYMLWMVKRVFWGPANAQEDSGTAHLHDDLNAREIAVMLPIVALIFWMGVHPQTFLGQSERQVGQMLTQAPGAAEVKR